jgi:general secretion pathway protein A
VYEEFYGFKEKPFSLTPDPKFFFLSEHHQAAFEHLLYGIREKAGFLLIIGEVGIGKTTLCRALLERVGKEVNVALIFNPSVSEVELLQAILMDFGLKVSSQGKKAGGQSKKELVDELNRFLLEEEARGRSSVLIIDEAQALSAQVLEEVRLLSNLETEKEKLLQIILMGQPELKAKLDLPDLRQLNQRISIRYTLQPLRKDEVALYIHHRLATASFLNPPIFTDAAMRVIYAYSQGIPRLINLVCDRALLGGYTQGTYRLTPKIVQEGIHSIQGDYRQRGLREFFKRRLILSGSLVLFLVSLLFALLSTGQIFPGVGLLSLSPQNLFRAGSPPPPIADQPKEVVRKQNPPPSEPDQQEEMPVKPQPPVTEDGRHTTPSAPQQEGSSPQQSTQPVAAKSNCQECSYTLRIASLKTRAQALEEIERLKKKLGSPVFSEKVELKDKGTWYRIYFGRFANHSEAELAKRKLKSQGWSTSMFVTRMAQGRGNESYR